MSNEKTSTFIRLCTPDDAPMLCSIEGDAASIYSTTGLSHLNEEMLDPISLLGMISAGTVWVAIHTVTRKPVGFVAATSLDNALHLEELSVCREYHRRGIGRRLVETAVDCARGMGAKEVTLITYRNLPWCGPFYQKLGFEVMEDGDMGNQLRRVKEEDRNRLEPPERVVMKRDM